jgi:hypothetical protein
MLAGIDPNGSCHQPGEIAAIDETYQGPRVVAEAELRGRVPERFEDTLQQPAARPLPRPLSPAPLTRPARHQPAKPQR